MDLEKKVFLNLQSLNQQDLVFMQVKRKVEGVRKQSIEKEVKKKSGKVESTKSR